MAPKGWPRVSQAGPSPDCAGPDSFWSSSTRTGSKGTGTMNTSECSVDRGSGNVFEDLDFPEADTHLLKAELVSIIDTIIRQRSTTQAKAAHALGLSPPELSRLLRGDFREYSLERLLRFLMALDCRYRHRHPTVRVGHRRNAARRRTRTRLRTPRPAAARALCTLGARGRSPTSGAGRSRRSRWSSIGRVERTSIPLWLRWPSTSRGSIVAWRCCWLKA